MDKMTHALTEIHILNLDGYMFWPVSCDYLTLGSTFGQETHVNKHTIIHKPMHVQAQL